MWRSTSKMPEPPDVGKVDLWLLDVRPCIAAEADALELLDDEERGRAERLRCPRARAQFVRTRAGLRRILASYLAVQPQSVPFAYGCHGKPRMPWGRLRFNVSHAGGAALLAFASECEVGVDLERIETIDAAEILTTWASPRDYAAWRASSPGDRLAALYRGWVRKEAILKAWGCGFSVAPQELDVPMSARAGEHIVVGTALHRPNCRVLDVPVGSSWTAALAVEGGAPCTASFIVQPA